MGVFLGALAAGIAAWAYFEQTGAQVMAGARRRRRNEDFIQALRRPGPFEWRGPGLGDSVFGRPSLTANTAARFRRAIHTAPPPGPALDYAPPRLEAGWVAPRPGGLFGAARTLPVSPTLAGTGFVPQPIEVMHSRTVPSGRAFGSLGDRTRRR